MSALGRVVFAGLFVAVAGMSVLAQQDAPKKPDDVLGGGGITVNVFYRKGPTHTPPAADTTKLNAVGVIRSVQCYMPQHIEFQVEVAAKDPAQPPTRVSVYNMDTSKIDYSTLETSLPDNFDPCRHMEGLKASVSYLPITDKTADGEVTAIQFLK